MWQRISAPSRWNATPSSPPGNSRSSLAIVLGRPATRAMPAPVAMAWPASARSTEGFQLSTFLRRAAAMVWGSIRSDAIVSAPECVLGVLAATRDGAMEEEIVDARDNAADHGGVDDDLDLNGAAGRPRQRPLQALALLVGQRYRRPDLGHGVLSRARGELHEGVGDLREI